MDDQNKKNESLGKMPGGVTREQIEKWKKQYGEVHVVEVKVEKGENVVGYLKPVKERNIYASVFSFMQAGKLLEAGEVILANCYLGGDELIKTDEQVAASAAMAAYNVFKLPEATVKKL